MKKIVKIEEVKCLLMPQGLVSKDECNVAQNKEPILFKKYHGLAK